MLVQVYGTTTVADARAIEALAPDHLGIVPDEGFEAWDAVGFETAGEIRAVLRHVRLVVASLASESGRVLATVRALRPDVVHLARASDMEDATLEAIRAGAPGIEVMATVPMVDDPAVGVAVRLAPFSDYLLLDTTHPQTGVVGATGEVHDWGISARIVDAVAVPVFLAGGLGPDNVAEAIERVHPAGVDSETRTSRQDDRRHKDLAKVEAFIARARAAR